MIWVKMATILVAAFSMLLAAVRHLFQMDEPELPAILFFLVLGIVLTVLNRGTTFLALRAWYRRHKLKRKAERYLADIRSRYGACS